MRYYGSSVWVLVNNLCMEHQSDQIFRILGKQLISSIESELAVTNGDGKVIVQDCNGTRETYTGLHT